jgi:hypothetical protein
VARHHGLITALTLLAVAPAARAAPSYPLYGQGDEPLRPGVLAAEVEIRQSPIALAARADGTVALATAGGIYTLREGRLVTVPAPRADGLALTYAPDGSLLVAVCPGFEDGRVVRAWPDRAPVVVAGGSDRRDVGDGGPAAAARLECPTAIDVDAAGGVLIADSSANRIRRIGPDGIVRTVAGGRAPRGIPRPYRRGTGDGGPATAAVLVAPYDVAALADGGFAVLDGERLRIVGPDGRISASDAPPTRAIAPHPDGLLLVDAEGRVWLRRAAGEMTSVTEPRRESFAIARELPVAGDPFGPDPANVGEAIVAPDGGVLVPVDFGVHYVPPPAPRNLAVALRPETRRPGTSLTVHLTTTLPAQVRIGVWRRGKRAALVTAPVPGGDAAIPIPQVHASGVYGLHVQAVDHDEVAATRADVLVGHRLPFDYARDFIRGRLDLFELVYDEHVEARCRRMSATRVDCAMRAGRRCRGIAGVRREADGSLEVLAYSGCRFSRRRGEPTRRRGLPEGINAFLLRERFMS